MYIALSGRNILEQMPLIHAISCYHHPLANAFTFQLKRERIVLLLGIPMWGIYILNINAALQLLSSTLAIEYSHGNRCTEYKTPK